MGLRLKVGLFTLLSLATLIGASLWLSQIRPFSRSYHFQIAFEDVYGLKDSSRVQLLGVRVGRVTRIALRPEIILVDVEIDDANVQIPVDSAITIGSLATGGKYIDIVPVIAGRAQRMVGPGMTVLGTSPVHLDTQFEKVQDRLAVIRNFLDDPAQQRFIQDQINAMTDVAERFNVLADGALRMSQAALARTGELDALAERRLPAMRQQLYQMRDMSRRMLASTEQLRGMGRRLGDQGQAMLQQLHAMTANARVMLDSIERQAAVGQVGAGFRRTLGNMRKLLQDIDTLLKLVQPPDFARPSMRNIPSGSSPTNIPSGSARPGAPVAPAAPLQTIP